MAEKNFDIIVTTEEGEKVHLRPQLGPPPNAFARMIGLPEEWEISQDDLDLEAMRLLYDEEDGLWKEVALVGSLHAWRVGDAGISVSGKYRTVRAWHQSPRSRGMVADGIEFCP